MLLLLLFFKKINQCLNVSFQSYFFSFYKLKGSNSNSTMPLQNWSKYIQTSGDPLITSQQSYQWLRRRGTETLHDIHLDSETQYYLALCGRPVDKCLTNCLFDDSFIKTFWHKLFIFLFIFYLLVFIFEVGRGISYLYQSCAFNF